MWVEGRPSTTRRWVISIGGFLSIVANSHGFRWIVNCPKPGVKDGTIMPDKPQYAAGDLVNITCTDGYTLIENGFLKCHEDGSWSRSPPYCEELRCPKLHAIQGLKQSNTSSIGGYIQFECDRGFSMIGNNTMYCDKNGTWLPNVMPYCRAITCQKLPHIMNGTVELKIQRKIQIAEFGCYQGFVLVGPPRLECGEDGIWTPDRMPRCDEKDFDTQLVPSVISLITFFVLLMILFLYLYKQWTQRRKRKKEEQITCGVSTDDINV